MNNFIQNYTPNNNISNYPGYPNVQSSFDNFGATSYQQYYSQPYDESNTNFWCDVCDRGFPNKLILQKHFSEHQTCNIDGCNYVAHPNVITKHIQMQHSNGLYNRIRSMNTPEDIAKWISDRKRKYPSKENIVKRQKINEEKKKRGEVLTSQSIRRSHNSRNTKRDSKTNIKKFGKFHNRSNKYSKPKLVNDVEVKVINKENWKGDLQPFPGTKISFPNQSSEEEEDDEFSDESLENIKDDRFDDEEWKEENIKIDTNIPIKNALGMLMCNYGSSDEDDSPESKILDTKPVDETQNDEPPDEEPIFHVQNNMLTMLCDKVDDNEPHNETDINIKHCEDFSVDNKMKQHSTDVNEHKSQNNIDGNNRKRKRNHKNNSDNNSKIDMNKSKSKKYFRKETLLEMLLRNEIRHERNILLQCVKYIVDNHFFGLNNNSN